MRVATVGVGTTNVLKSVNRPWMGTGLGTHQSGDNVTKIVGNYNILDNNFTLLQHLSAHILSAQLVDV